ncbi:hypothetical protein ACKKBG_A01445 [Auxenochlorella protothecoides x Auxenochlorella symbiontica]
MSLPRLLNLSGSRAQSSNPPTPACALVTRVVVRSLETGPSIVSQFRRHVSSSGEETGSGDDLPDADANTHSSNFPTGKGEHPRPDVPKPDSPDDVAPEDLDAPKSLSKDDVQRLRDLE